LTSDLHSNYRTSPVFLVLGLLLSSRDKAILVKPTTGGARVSDK